MHIIKFTKNCFMDALVNIFWNVEHIFPKKQNSNAKNHLHRSPLIGTDIQKNRPYVKYASNSIFEKFDFQRLELDFLVIFSKLTRYC